MEPLLLLFWRRRFNMKQWILAFSSLFLTANLHGKLPPLNIDAEHITVSGLSSGGYMASQFHLAHGDWVSGIGIIAAGPYYCAKNNIFTALAECVNKIEKGVSLGVIEQQISSWRQQKLLAPAESLTNDKVWIFHGTLDQRIHSKVSDKLVEQYSSWVKKDNIKYINHQAFAHHFPTIDNGINCSDSKAPFIGNCGYDAATKMLNFISDATITKGQTGSLVEIDQQQLGGKSASSLADKGYVYIPQNCQQGRTCKVHVSFHGCNQNAEAVGNTYASQTGINQWADQHNMLVLYPQTKKSSLMPLNPQACWDWWGYTDEYYATRQGAQIKAIKNMILALAGEQ